MEHAIANEVSEYVLQHGLISKQQHGFLAKKTTVTNLVETLNDWTLVINTRQSVTVAYIDLERRLIQLDNDWTLAANTIDSLYL